MKSHCTPFSTSTNFTAQPGTITTARANIIQTQEPIPYGRVSPDDSSHDKRRQAESEKCQRLGFLTGWSMAAMRELQKMNAELRQEVAEGQSQIGQLTAKQEERRTTKAPSPHPPPVPSSQPRLFTPHPSSEAGIQTLPDPTSTTLVELMARFRRLTKEDIPKLKDELETQRSQFDQQSQALALSEKRAAMLQHQLGDEPAKRLESEIKLAFANEQVNKLQSTVSSQAKEVQDMASRVEQLLGDVNRSRAEATNLRARLSSQNALRRERERVIQAGEEKLKLLEAEVTTLRGGHSTEVEKSKLDHEKQASKENPNCLQQTLDASRCQIRTLEDDLRVSRRANERMSDQISIERSRHDTIKNDKEKLESLIEEMKVVADRASEAYSALDAQVAALKVQIEEEKSAKGQALANLRLLQDNFRRMEEVRDDWVQAAQKTKDDLDHACDLIEARNEELANLKGVRKVEQTTQTVDISTAHAASTLLVEPPSLPPTPLLPPTPTLPSLAPLPLFLPSPSPSHSPVPMPPRSPSESQSSTYRGLFTDVDDSPVSILDEVIVPAEKAIIEVLERGDKLFIRAPKSSRQTKRDGFQKVVLSVSPFTVSVCVSWPVSGFISEDDYVPLLQPLSVLENIFEEKSDSSVRKPDVSTDAVARPTSKPLAQQESLSEDSEYLGSFPISFRTRSQRKRKRQYDEITSESESDTASESSPQPPYTRPQRSRKRQRTRIVLSDDENFFSFSNDENLTYPLTSPVAPSPIPTPYWPTHQRAYVDVPPLSSSWLHLSGA